MPKQGLMAICGLQVVFGESARATKRAVASEGEPVNTGLGRLPNGMRARDMKKTNVWRGTRKSGSLMQLKT